MEIAYLQDHPAHLPTVARWQWEEWGRYRPGETLAIREARLKTRLGHVTVPTTLVALEDGNPVGSAGLLASDMETRPELTPWLAGVYVPPAHRRQGIAARLIERIAKEARALGYPALYLYSFSIEAYYARQGWQTLEHTQYLGAQVTIMHRAL